MCSVLARGLFLRHDVTACFALHMVNSLHNVVNNARFHAVEINPIIVLLGDPLVRADQLLISEGPLNRVSSHFQVNSELVVHMYRLTELHV